MRALEAPGLVLEPQTASHAEAMFAVLSDPAIYAYENDPPASVESLRERFARLEARRSADGREQWLNWVIRLPGGELAGFVQATVRLEGDASIAYVLSPAYWGRGIARGAVEAMIAELAAHQGVREVFAVLKAANLRSLRLLQRLGFERATPQAHAAHAVPADEVLMARTAAREPG